MGNARFVPDSLTLDTEFVADTQNGNSSVFGNTGFEDSRRVFQLIAGGPIYLVRAQIASDDLSASLIIQWMSVSGAPDIIQIASVGLGSLTPVVGSLAHRRQARVGQPVIFGAKAYIPYAFASLTGSTVSCAMTYGVAVFDSVAITPHVLHTWSATGASLDTNALFTGPYLAQRSDGTFLFIRPTNTLTDNTHYNLDVLNADASAVVSTQVFTGDGNGDLHMTRLGTGVAISNSTAVNASSLIYFDATGTQTSIALPGGTWNVEDLTATPSGVLVFAGTERVALSSDLVFSAVQSQSEATPVIAPRRLYKASAWTDQDAPDSVNRIPIFHEVSVSAVDKPGSPAPVQGDNPATGQVIVWAESGLEDIVVVFVAPFAGATTGSLYLIRMTVVPPYFRMAQRNDGIGPTTRHPRLRESVGSSSSKQTGRAPRIGDSNRYI